MTCESEIMLKYSILDVNDIILQCKILTDCGYDTIQDYLMYRSDCIKNKIIYHKEVHFDSVLRFNLENNGKKDVYKIENYNIEKINENSKKQKCNLYILPKYYFNLKHKCLENIRDIFLIVPLKQKDTINKIDELKKKYSFELKKNNITNNSYILKVYSIDKSKCYNYDELLTDEKEIICSSLHNVNYRDIYWCNRYEGYIIGKKVYDSAKTIFL